MDIFGPLKRTKLGHKYVLVIVDYATKWPEAFPLKNMTSETVVNCLIDMTARMGVPEEILTDNGANFISKTMRQFCQITGIHQIKTSPYHPQTDGMVERFNSTLKRLLRKLTQTHNTEWDECLPFVLWAYRGTIHSTTGFSPYHLLFGREMRLPLDELTRYWKGKEETSVVDVVEYVKVLKANIELVQEMAQKNEQKQKESSKYYHDQRAVDRVFNVGEFVLVFRPRKTNKLHNEWQGPFIITEKITDVTYKVDLGLERKRYRTFHINGMKPWISPEAAVFLSLENEFDDQYPLELEDKLPTHLTLSQQQQLVELKENFKDVFQDVPGRTDVVTHDIPTGDARPVRLPPYRLAHKSQDFLREEIKTLLQQEIIEPSKSPWAAPIVLVAKKDGSTRMCVDYRKLNAITQADPYPLPRIEELIDGIGQSTFITTLDLTKGYYQVPMEQASKDKTAFVTPFGKYQFRTMPFGLISAPSTFQRLMDEVLRELYPFAVAYLDDILIHSATWEDHLGHLSRVLQRIRQAGLRIKARKCNFAVNECKYLGHIVGKGRIRPMQCKVDAVQAFTQPTTKKQVRAFTGLCGYYRRFIPNFSTIATPLTELTRKRMDNKVKWTPPCEQSFQWLKKMLTEFPVLVTPDWKRMFILQTDASDSGLGYVLSQINEDGEEHPIAFESRKLLPRERKYSAIEREALAIVSGIRHFRTYLEGTKFEVQTDHNPLIHMPHMKDSHGRIGRWALALQPFNFTVKHRAGAANNNADGLSREHSFRVEEGEMSGEALTLANGQSLVDNTTRCIQGNTTTTPTEKYSAKTSQGEVGRSDWLPGEDTMVTK